MFEILMGIAVVVILVKAADAENMSPLLWGAAAALCVLASLTLPWPFFRVLLAGVVCFAAMTAYNVFRKP